MTRGKDGGNYKRAGQYPQSKLRQGDPEIRKRGYRKQNDDPDPHQGREFVFVYGLALLFAEIKIYRGKAQLYADNVHRYGKAGYERSADKASEQERERRKSDEHFDKKVKIIGERVFLRVYPHYEYRIEFVFRRVENAGVQKSADERKKYQRVGKSVGGRGFYNGKLRPDDKQIQSLARKRRKEFYNCAYYISEDLKSAARVKRRGKNLFYQRDIFQRPDDAVRFICNAEAERLNKSFKHLPHLAMRRLSYP